MVSLPKYNREIVDEFQALSPFHLFDHDLTASQPGMQCSNKHLPG
jgi:hypothetical protein